VAGLEPCAANRTYNLVSDEDVTIRQIAEHVRDAIGNVELVETKGRAAEFKGAEVCGKRAAAELGWTPRTPFADGLRHYVAWHRAHVDVAPPVAVPVVASTPEPLAETAPAPRARSRARRVVRDVALVLVGLMAALLAALAGTLLDALWDGTGDVSHFARGHILLTLLLVGSVLATGVGVRRRVAERP
jgi:hypothetical protein